LRLAGPIKRTERRGDWEADISATKEVRSHRLAVFRTARYARRLSRGVCSRVRPTGPREIGTLAGLGEKKPGVTTQAVFVRLSFQEPR
jgi:hypothetical protein